jgi:glycosyltransferase involved in cell wall biosynthesis
MSIRRLWLVDHLLRDRFGHHLGYNLAIADAAHAGNLEAVLVGHRRFDGALCPGHRSVRVFRTDWRAAPPAWISRDQRFLRLLEAFSAARFRGDIRRFGSMVGPDDLVFAQMIAPRHFRAWLAWLGATEDPPRLVLHLGYQPHRFDRDEARRALSKLSADRRRRLVLVTDSEKLQDPFERALHASVDYLPHIVGHRFADAVPERPPGPLRFLAPGNARKEKGFAELLDAIGLLGDLCGDRKVHFRVQCHDPDRFCAPLARLAEPMVGAEFVDGVLGDEDYFAQFVSADIVLVPYHLDHYSMRTSGVFCEARTAGKPVVASRGSWAGDRVAREGGGWLCEERNGAELAKCIREAVQNGGAKAAQAAALQGGARQEFGAGSFLQGLAAVANRDP